MTSPLRSQSLPWLLLSSVRTYRRVPGQPWLLYCIRTLLMMPVDCVQQPRHHTIPVVIPPSADAPARALFVDILFFFSSSPSSGSYRRLARAYGRSDSQQTTTPTLTAIGLHQVASCKVRPVSPLFLLLLLKLLQWCLAFCICTLSLYLFFSSCARPACAPVTSGQPPPASSLLPSPSRSLLPLPLPSPFLDLVLLGVQKPQLREYPWLIELENAETLSQKWKHDFGLGPWSNHGCSTFVDASHPMPSHRLTALTERERHCHDCHLQESHPHTEPCVFDCTSSACLWRTKQAKGACIHMSTDSDI